ncbi:MAG: MMPL family transporter [Acidimicrobiales bacterium]
MDYEVFLVSRVRDSWLLTGDNHQAVATGLAATARVITSAALIMPPRPVQLVATCLARPSAPASRSTTATRPRPIPCRQAVPIRPRPAP